jgi:hypothetical protein
MIDAMKNSCAAKSGNPKCTRIAHERLPRQRFVAEAPLRRRRRSITAMAIRELDMKTIRQQIEEDGQRINQQMEAGKKIIRNNFSEISKEFNRPDINEFSFDTNDSDFDCDRISILDMDRRVVMKVSEKKLTDIPSPKTPEVRLEFEARLRAAVIFHFKLSMPS